MAQNTSISLDEHFSDFLANQVSSGRYRTASEVVRAGLRLLEDQDTQLAALRAVIERIADDPSRGRPYYETRHGYRFYGIGRHLLFYVTTTVGVDVIAAQDREPRPSACQRAGRLRHFRRGYGHP